MSSEGTTPILSRRSGILTREEILEYNLIKHLAEGKLNSTTYDLRLDDRHLVYEHKTKSWGCVFIGKNSVFEKVKLKGTTSVTQAKCLRLQPFESAIIQLFEAVDTYSCLSRTDLIESAIICGRFDLKLKVIMKNIVSQQATQVEPGYQGKLFCLITNQSESEVTFDHLQSMASIEFSYASSTISKKQHEDIIKNINETNNKKYIKDGKKKNFCNSRGLDDVRYFIEDRDFIISSGGMINNFVTQQKMQDFVDDKVNKIIDDKLKWYKDSTDQSIRTIQWLIAAGVALSIFLANQFVNNLKEQMLKKTEATGQSINVSTNTELGSSKTLPLKVSGSYNPIKKIETSVGLNGSIAKISSTQKGSAFDCNTTVPSNKSFNIQVNCK